MIDKTTPLADIAGVVATALQELGYDAVVVGGSAATLYLGEWTTRDFSSQKWRRSASFSKTACLFTR